MTPTEPPLGPERLDPGAPPVARLWALALGGGALAGLLSWLIGEATHTFFVPPTRQVVVMGMPLEVVGADDQAWADRRNATLVFSVLGASLGLVLGAAGGLARKSLPAGGRGALAGVLLGLAAGAGATAVLLQVYYHRQEQAQEDLARDLAFPLLIHGGIWATIGAAGGAAFGIGLGGRRRVAIAALGGLLGGGLGAVVYEFVGIAVFADARTTQPLAISWAPRLLTMLAVSILTATMVALTITSSSRKPSPAPGVPSA